MKFTKSLMWLFVVSMVCSVPGAMSQQLSRDSSSVRVDSLVRVGARFYAEARFAEAIHALLRAGADSGSAQARFYLGMSYLSLNEYEQANRFLLSASRADTGNTGYQFRLAVLQAQLGKVNDATREYESILKRDPYYVPALFNMGLLYLDQKEWDKSAQYLNRAIRQSPRDFLSFYYLGVAMNALERRDSAVVCFATSMTLNPNYAPAVSNLAALHYDRKEYEEALRLYLKAAALRPSSGEYAYKSGLCYQQRKLWEDALRSFEKATLLNPIRDEYAAQLGYAYFQVRKFDSSAYAYLKAIRIDSTNSLYYLNLAFAYSSLDSAKQAVTAFQRAIRYRRPDEIAKITIQLGNFYFAKNQFADAAGVYRKALGYDASSRDAQFYLGLTYERLKDVRKAATSYERFLALQPKDTTGSNLKDFAKKRLQALRKKMMIEQ